MWAGLAARAHFCLGFSSVWGLHTAGFVCMLERGRVGSVLPMILLGRVSSVREGSLGAIFLDGISRWVWLWEWEGGGAVVRSEATLRVEL